MNQTYFEWYEIDVNVVRLLIATDTHNVQCCDDYK